MRGRLYWAIVVLCLVGSGYQVLQYQREQRWLAGRAQAIVQAVHARSREEQIKALRDYIRHHVRAEGLSDQGRPFLRATAKEALVTGQGFCGEATRAFIALSRELGVAAQRINLDGRTNHVVAQTELAPQRWVLVDVQENPVTNGFLDRRWWAADEAITAEDTMGLPVVASDIRGCREEVVPNRTGLLVAPRDPEALAAAVGSLIEDPAAAAGHGCRGSLAYLPALR